MEDNEKTPETPPATKPEEVVAKPEETGHNADAGAELRSTVAALSDRVTSMESTLTSLLPENRDETPTKRPWTHRKFGG